MSLTLRCGAKVVFRLRTPYSNSGLLQPHKSFQQLHRLTPVRMVEGHGCHRVAHAHRKLLVGKRFTAMSPNSRFTEGAHAVNNIPLTRIEVHGKNLFYFFGDEASPHIVHIHFGMSGAFKTMTLPGPEPTDTTRLTLVNQELGIIASLSAMTVVLGDLNYYKQKAAKLGPDPLRADADGELLWQKMQISKKPVGAILMDQTAVAGIGNIFRAEILFKAGVHPEQPCKTVSRAEFETLWRHSVLLLQRGFKTGSILTVDEEEAKQLGKPWTRRYVYNHKTCGRCGSSIRTWDMATRTVYACEVCQPLRLEAGTELDPARAKALSASGPTKQFKSHCAPEAFTQAVPAQMTVAELKAALSGQGWAVNGNKGVLVARLEQAQAAAAGTSVEAMKQEQKPEGPIGGVPPGLPGQEDQIIEGPEPLMGVKDLDAVEKGNLASGSSQAPADKDLAAQQEIPPAKMTVSQLKEQLRTFNMFTSGKKADLVHRLETALAASATTGHASDAHQASDSASDDADTGAAPAQNADADTLTKVAAAQAAVDTVTHLEAAIDEALADAQSARAAFQDATVTVGDVSYAPKSTAAAAKAMAVDHYVAVKSAEALNVAQIQANADAADLINAAHEAAGMGTEAEGSDRDQQAVSLAEMTVPQLKEQLRTFNMSVSGKKADLMHRLETAVAARDAAGVGARAEGDGRGQQGRQPVAGVQPGTEGLGEMTTFEEAAKEKAVAGEGRNVEHVAEADDLTHVNKRARKQPSSSKQPTAAAQPSNQPKRQRRQTSDAS